MAHWIDPSSRIADRASLEEDGFVGPGCSIGFWGYQHGDWTPRTFAALDDLPDTVIASGCRILGNSVIGAGTRIGREFRGDYFFSIGERCVVGNRVIVEYGARIYDRCVIGDDVVIGGFLCNEAVIGDGSVVQGSLIHKRVARGPEPAPVVGKGVLVGTGSLIIGGIEIADRTFVAAGAVVTRNTESGYLYAGIPARKIRRAEWH